MDLPVRYNGVISEPTNSTYVLYVTMMLCFTRVNETEATVSNVSGAIYIFLLIGWEYSPSLGQAAQKLLSKYFGSFSESNTVKIRFKNYMPSGHEEFLRYSSILLCR